MKSAALRGPWAFYEKRSQEQTQKIEHLEEQCRRWKSQLEDTLQKKETLECTFQLQRVELESKNGMLENLENGMQEQTKINTALSKETEQKRKELDAQISELRGEVGRLSAENDVLRGEVKAHLQVKVSAQSKVEKLRKKLGFTTDESKHIVQELDTMRDKNVELAKLNDQLKSENGLLKDQCNQHSRHCLMLIKENQRLMDHTDRLREKIRTLEEGAKTAPIIKVESSKVQKQVGVYHGDDVLRKVINQAEALSKKTATRERNASSPTRHQNPPENEHETKASENEQSKHAKECPGHNCLSESEEDTCSSPEILSDSSSD